MRLLSLLIAALAVATPAWTAGLDAPAARADADSFALTVNEGSIEAGDRPSFTVRGEGTRAGEVRLVILRTFGSVAGAPEDTAEWEAVSSYDGDSLHLDGPVLRVGEYRVEAWFAPSGGGPEGDAPDASAEFAVHRVAGTSAAGGGRPEDIGTRPSAAVLISASAGIVVLGGFALALVVRRRSHLGAREPRA